MNTRRSFFKKIATAIAIVALAPEIAFRTKIAPTQAALEPVLFWIETKRVSRFTSKGYDEMIKQIGNRLSEGLNQNYHDHLHYATIDRAYKQPI